MKVKLLGVFICTLLVALTVSGPVSAQPVCEPVPANTVITTINNIPFAEAVVVDHYRGLVYVSGLPNVSVIDEATNAVITTIPVSGDVATMALDPFRGTVYAVSYIGATVSIIDEATNTVTGAIPLPIPGNSFAIGIDPFRRKVYLGVWGGKTAAPTAHYVAVIDEATNTVTSIITLPDVPGGVGESMGIGVDPIRGVAWVTGGVGLAGATDQVYAIDERTDTITATIQLPGQSFAPAVDPINGLVYVPNNTGTVIVINEATNTVAATITTDPTGNATTSVGLDPVTKTAYVSNYGPTNANNSYGDGYLSIIDTVTNTITDTITLGGAAGGPGRGVAVDPVRRTVYVTNWKLNTVTVISTGGPTPWRHDWRDPFGDFLGDHWKR